MKDAASVEQAALPSVEQEREAELVQRVNEAALEPMLGGMSAVQAQAESLMRGLLGTMPRSVTKQARIEAALAMVLVISRANAQLRLMLEQKSKEETIEGLTSVSNALNMAMQKTIAYIDALSIEDVAKEKIETMKTIFHTRLSNAQMDARVAAYQAAQDKAAEVGGVVQMVPGGIAIAPREAKDDLPPLTNEEVLVS